MMVALFKTVLLLSCIGSVLTCLLLVLKPLTAKRLSASWQKAAWLLAAIFMLVPVWKAVPQKSAEMLAENIPVRQAEQPVWQEETKPYAEEMNMPEDIQGQTKNRTPVFRPGTHLPKLAAYIWFGGGCIYLITAWSSYVVFLFRKRRKSVALSACATFEAVKKELKIRRNIRARVACDGDSPMLTGIFFPVIYVPDVPTNETAERMMYRHELTHYTHRDLFIKWAVLFINAVHWFNPFAYFLSSNISQICEISCDMAVIKELNEEEQRLYMHTILNLVEEKGRKINV